jgi:hypothetical protein
VNSTVRQRVYDFNVSMRYSSVEHEFVPHTMRIEELLRTMVISTYNVNGTTYDLEVIQNLSIIGAHAGNRDSCAVAVWWTYCTQRLSLGCEIHTSGLGLKTE